MVYNSNDVYIGRSLTNYGEFSHKEVELFEKIVKHGMIALDVGANIGAHTLALAKLVGKNGLVFAYEPQRLSYYMLCANVALNSLTNVYCIQNAIGKTNGRIDVPELDYSKENNFGGVDLNATYECSNKCSVKLIRLDDVSFPKVDFIKIDVEGMEGDVINGAKDIIAKYKPILYVENDKPELISLLVKIVRALDYEIYFHAPPLYNPNNILNNERNIFGFTSSINMLCHHKEVILDIQPEEFNLVRLKDDGKILFKNSPEDMSKMNVNIIENVIQSLVNASIYYSDNLFEHDRALALSEMAVRVNPDDCRGYYQSAMVFCKKCDYQTALKFLDITLEKDPKQFKAIFNKATVLAGLGRYKDAIAEYRRALEKQPNAANVRFYFACCLIADEQFEEGFKEYESRFSLPKIKQFTNLLPNIPIWNGEPLKGKRILLFCEQGAGDLIQHARYAKKFDGHVALAATKNMTKLLKQCEGVSEIIQFNSDDRTTLPNNFDYACSVMSLPKYFGILECDKYIKPIDTQLPCTLDKEHFNIGISWAGNEMHVNDFGRSCHLEHFKVLQDIPKVKLYSLQKGEMKRTWSTEGKVDLLEGSKSVKLEDYASSFEDFNDTANFVKGLDLVISVDTSVAHIAGAMGVPVWLLIGFCPDQRWGTHATSTPWYPSMKLFRQLNYGLDWNYVFQQVKEELQKNLQSWNRKLL